MVDGRKNGGGRGGETQAVDTSDQGLSVICCSNYKDKYVGDQRQVSWADYEVHQISILRVSYRNQ